jgi:hypothetical protein
MQKLCTNCFENHTRRACNSKKVLWVDYARDFFSINQGIFQKYFYKWSELTKHAEKAKGVHTSIEQDPAQSAETDNQTASALMLVKVRRNERQGGDHAEKRGESERPALKETVSEGVK